MGAAGLPKTVTKQTVILTYQPQQFSTQVRRTELFHSIIIMCQTTTPITWPQTRKYSMLRVQDQQESSTEINIITNVEKFNPKLVLPGVEPETSTSKAIGPHRGHQVKLCIIKV